jgi:hypothetical protein
MKNGTKTPTHIINFCVMESDPAFAPLKADLEELIKREGLTAEAFGNMCEASGDEEGELVLEGRFTKKLINSLIPAFGALAEKHDTFFEINPF